MRFIDMYKEERRLEELLELTEEYIACKESRISLRDKQDEMGEVEDVQITWHDSKHYENYFSISIPSLDHLGLCSVYENYFEFFPTLDKHTKKTEILKLAINYWEDTWGNNDDKY